MYIYYVYIRVYIYSTNVISRAGYLGKVGSYIRYIHTYLTMYIHT